MIQQKIFNSLSDCSNEFIDVDEIDQKKEFKVVSLFSGCGGMDLGFKGDFTYLNKYYEKNPYNIVFSNDISPQACKTYEYNFKHSSICNDIKNIDLNSIPLADIVIGGFPCQDFSLAGKRKGLSSERGQLYLEMKRVIEQVKPKCFVAENVGGITIPKAGNKITALDKIIEDFTKAGYRTRYRALNSADYGIPQTRIRIIIIGIKEELNKNPKFPRATHGQNKSLRWVTAKDAIDDLWDLLDNTTISNHTSKDYSHAKFYENSKSQGNYQIASDRPSPTIRSEHHGNIEGHYRTTDEENLKDMTKWRRLSVRECARLQSFPDDFCFPVSSSYAYKQVGNAVPPVLSWNIARAIHKTLNS